MRDLIKNTKSLRNIPTINSVGYEHAYLVLEGTENIPKSKTPNNRENRNQKIQQGKTVFDFIYNPESLSISLPIEWKSTPIPFNNVPQLNYSYGGSRTLDINDIYLDSYYERKSLQPILDALVNLRNPTIKNGVLLSPPVLYFKWGMYTSFSCVLTNISYTVTNTINGLPCRARLNLSFKEIPSKTNRLESQTTIQSTATKPLTQKQSKDGAKLATKTIKNNQVFEKIPKPIQKLITDKLVSIRVDTHTNLVELVNKGLSVLKIGTYNGDKLILDDKLTDKNFTFK